MNETQKTRIKRLQGFWDRAKSGNRAYYDQALLNKKFYKGEQWSPSDMENMKDKNVYPLTINLLLSQIDILTGLERQNRQDIVAYPRRGGTVQAASALTELSKHAIDMSKGNYKLSFVFIDGLILLKGWVGLEVDYTHDPLNGDIEVVRYPSLSMLEDPECKSYDINDLKMGAEFVFNVYYWDKEELELHYPEEAKKLETPDAGSTKLEDTIGNNWPEYKNVEYSTDYKSASSSVTNEKTDKKYLIKECWWRSREKRAIFYSTKGLIQRRVLRSSKAIDAARQMSNEDTNGYGFAIKDDVITIMNKTVFVGDQELEHKEDPFNGRVKYKYSRFCPYFIDGDIFGYLDNLLESQREINKRRTQTLDIVNRGPNGMWAIEEGSLNPDSEDDLEDLGSKPGTVLKYKAGKQKPERIEPPQLNQAHVGLSEMSVRDLEKIGQNPDLLGNRQDRLESGRAILLRQQAGMMKVEGLFDNFRWTKEMIGEALIDMIRMPNSSGKSIYSDDEIRAIIDKEDLVDKETLFEATQVVGDITTEDLAALDPMVQQVVIREYEQKIKHVGSELFIQKLRRWGTGRYGVRVTERPTGPTARIMNMEMLFDLLKAYPALGQVIPPEVILEMSDIVNKDKIIAAIEREKEKMSMAAMGPMG